MSKKVIVRASDDLHDDEAGVPRKAGSEFVVTRAYAEKLGKKVTISGPFGENAPAKQPAANAKK